MRVAHELRRRGRAIAGPVLGISLVCYFAYHLFVGDRGLLAWMELTQELRDAKATLAALDAERETLARRVGLTVQSANSPRKSAGLLAQIDGSARMALRLTRSQTLRIVHGSSGS